MPNKSCKATKRRVKRKPGSSVVHPLNRKPDAFDMLAQAAHDETSERLATPEELATVQSNDPYIEFGGSALPAGWKVESDTPDRQSSYVAGSAVAKYGPQVEDFGWPILWERAYVALDRLQRFASRLRPRIMAESIEAFRGGFRLSFERQILEAAYASLNADMETHCSKDSEDRKWAFKTVLVAVIAQDAQGVAEMVELQGLPVSRRAAGLRLLAFNALVERHWLAAGMVVNRVDVRVQALMASFRRAGIRFPENAQKRTYRALVRALSTDAALCSQLAAPPEGSSSEIYSHIDKHLGRIVKSGLRGKDGQTVAEGEHAAVHAQLFAEVQHNG